ncbi:MAG: transcription antitermination factor NusB, partial [Bacilli bacterium]
MSNFILTRRQVRVSLVIYLYQYFIYKSIALENNSDLDIKVFISKQTRAMNLIVAQMFKIKQAFNMLDDYLFVEVISRLNEIDKAIQVIDEYLDDTWLFERLNKVEQAILVCAYLELTNDKVAKNIIMNEYISITKEYCDDDSY